MAKRTQYNICLPPQIGNQIIKLAKITSIPKSILIRNKILDLDKDNFPEYKEIEIFRKSRNNVHISTYLSREEIEKMMKFIGNRNITMARALRFICSLLCEEREQIEMAAPDWVVKATIEEDDKLIGEGVKVKACSYNFPNVEAAIKFFDAIKLVG